MYFLGLHPLSICLWIIKTDKVQRQHTVSWIHPGQTWEKITCIHRYSTRRQLVYPTEAIKEFENPLEPKTTPPASPCLPISAQLCKTKHPLLKWSPLNTYKHIKHGCLHWPSMTAFMGGVGNERPAVERDKATSKAIITQVCGLDEGSKTASATGMPLLCCRPCCQKRKREKKITGFISGGIK